MGVAPDKLEHIFEPFEQENASTSRRYGGTGLGLAICKTLAEMMGGAADAKSEIGKGSLFGFTALLEPTGSLEADPSEPAITSTSMPRQILLAEDGVVNQRVAIGLLEQRGHHIDLVENGRQALEAIATKDYDIVLMDVQMPEMDGLTAVRLLRERESARGTRQRVIAMTAHAMSGDKERFVEAGMDGYLVKPFKPDDLFAAVEQGSKQNTFATVATQTLTNFAGDFAARGVESEILDISAGLDATGGDVELAKALQTTCLDESPELIESAKIAVKNSDWSAARRCGHSLKSSFGAIGAKLAAAKSEELEFINEDNPEKFEQAIEAVETALQELAAQIEFEP